MPPLHRPRARSLFLGAFLIVRAAALHAQILDLTFNPSPNGEVRAITVQADERILVGGSFTNIAGTPRSYFTRLGVDGSSDASSLAVVGGGPVFAIALQPDGKIVIGGAFSSVGGLSRSRIARLNSNGSVDTTFSADVSGIVEDVAVQPDGRIIIAGGIVTVNGQPRARLARLNADGSLDALFAPTATVFPSTTSVERIVLQPDGRIVVGGQFSFLNDRPRSCFGRLFADGTLDESFNAEPTQGGGGVYDVVRLPEGKFLVGGNAFALGTGRYEFTRTNGDGSADRTFPTNVGGAVFAIDRDGDGGIWIGGTFFAVNTIARRGLARLRSDGSLDSSFVFDASGVTGNSSTVVRRIRAAEAGRIYVGGNFLALGGTPRPSLARFVPPALRVIRDPQSATVPIGSPIALSVIVTGSTPAYQWMKDGSALPGETNATLSFAAVAPANVGKYEVVATNSLGSVRSAAATLEVVKTARLSNVSVRAALARNQNLIVGFVVARGSTDILARAAGPALAQFGVATAMTDPRIDLYRDSTRLLENDNWPAGLADAAADIGAFPFATNSRDAALVQSLSGAHSIVATGSDAGVVLVEAYDAGRNQAGRLVNLSARNEVGRGADILIAGLSVGGVGTLNVLVRAVGPTLAAPPFGLTGVLADPKLEIFDANAVKLGENDNWEPALGPVFTRAGAFPLAPGAKDAAMVAVLTGGKTYTVQVTGADGGTGMALVEVFELPDSF